jgi:hypothetical protein
MILIVFLLTSERFGQACFLQCRRSDRIGRDAPITPEMLWRINWTMVLAIPFYRAPWNKVRALQSVSPIESGLFLFVLNLSCHKEKSRNVSGLGKSPTVSWTVSLFTIDLSIP